MMTWVCDSKCAVNTHFGKVNETRQAFGYTGDDLNIEDVFKSVLLANIKTSENFFR
jgi:hypothetical protein